jgi:hypothetical protein
MFANEHFTTLFNMTMAGGTQFLRHDNACRFIPSIRVKKGITYIAMEPANNDPDKRFEISDTDSLSIKDQDIIINHQNHQSHALRIIHC